jgi:hypothetical protein
VLDAHLVRQTRRFAVEAVSTRRHLPQLLVQSRNLFSFCVFFISGFGFRVSGFWILIFDLWFLVSGFWFRFWGALGF